MCDCIFKWDENYFWFLYMEVYLSFDWVLYGFVIFVCVVLMLVRFFIVFFKKNLWWGIIIWEEIRVIVLLILSCLFIFFFVRGNLMGIW